MIFVTLGTQFFPFDRVTLWLDNLLKNEIIQEPVIFQYGVTSVSTLDHPLLTKVPSLSPDEMRRTIQQSSLIISHAGQGSTRLLAQLRSRFVLLPRLKKYGEHVDDHQLGFTQAVARFGVAYCTELDQLIQFIHEPPAPFYGDLLAGPPLVDYLVTRYSY